MLKPFFSSLLILFCTALVETTILADISFLPVVPDFMLIISVYLSLVNGRTFGVCTGFASGLLLDFMTGCPFGLNSLVRTVLGYAAGFLSDTVHYSGVFVSAFIIFLATILKYLLIAFVALFYPRLEPTYSIFSLFFLFELAMNTVLTPLMFRFLQCFSSHISASGKGLD